MIPLIQRIQFLKELNYSLDENLVTTTHRFYVPGGQLLVNGVNKTFKVKLREGISTFEDIEDFFQHLGYKSFDEDIYDYCPKIIIGNCTIIVNPVEKKYTIYSKQS